MAPVREISDKIYVGQKSQRASHWLVELGDRSILVPAPTPHPPSPPLPLLVKMPFLAAASLVPTKSTGRLSSKSCLGQIIQSNHTNTWPNWNTHSSSGDKKVIQNSILKNYELDKNIPLGFMTLSLFKRKSASSVYFETIPPWFRNTPFVLRIHVESRWIVDDPWCWVLLSSERWGIRFGAWKGRRGVGWGSRGLLERTSEGRAGRCGWQVSEVWVDLWGRFLCQFTFFYSL